MTTTELARRDSLEFMHYTKLDFQEGRHHRLFADLVNRLVYGENLRIMISVPPRHTKSEFFSIRLPAMYLGHHPERDVVLVSHTLTLASGFGRQVRSLLRDDLNYRRLFPKVVLDADRQRVDDWRVDGGGGMKTLGVGGGLTGHGAHLLILDDIVKEGDEQSPTTLEQHFDWYISAARTRLAPGANIVIVMTRWHTQDIIGRLQQLAKLEPLADQWEVIELPARAKENDILGRDVGQALWPERFSERDLEAVRVSSEKYFEALYQQSPLDEFGKLFVAEDFRRFPEEQWSSGVWAFDLAMSEKEAGDYTTIGRWQYDKDTGVLKVQQLKRFKESWPIIKQEIKKIVRENPSDVFVFPKHLLELATLQDLRHELPDYTNQFKAIDQKGDKHERAAYHADRVKSGRFFVEQSPEGDSFIKEHDMFPGVNDDWVDMASVAAHHFGLHTEFRLIMGQDTDERWRKDLLEREKEWLSTLERIGDV